MPALPFHPLADIFPTIEGVEFDEMVASIKAHGLREPITLYEGAILDGRNRYRACEAAGIEPRFVKFTGTDLYAFVADMNLHRRHMSPSQLGMAGAKMATWKLGENQHNQHTKQGVEISTPSSEQVAEMLGINRTTVMHGKLVLTEGTPEEIRAVEQGKAAVSTTAAAIRARNPNKNRKTGHSNNVGKNPEKYQQQKINAAVWNQFRDALIDLTGLPRAADVVRIARTYDGRTGTIEARLLKSIQWLTEFETAWRQKDAA